MSVRPPAGASNTRVEIGPPTMERTMSEQNEKKPAPQAALDDVQVTELSDEVLEEAAGGMCSAAYCSNGEN